MHRRAIGRWLLLVALFVSHDVFAAAKTLRVLFVGNSLTYYNDLPATFASLYRAIEPGTKVETEMLAQGGGRLRERLDEGVLAAQLTWQHYDLVVLQDIGGWPECAPELPGCTDAPLALRETVNLVRANGARAVWFATWQWIPAAQRSLSASSASLAREIGVEIVDTGATMQRVPSKLRAQLLHKDGHPAVMGTWLIAARAGPCHQRATLAPDGAEILRHSMAGPSSQRGESSLDPTSRRTRLPRRHRRAVEAAARSGSESLISSRT